MEKVKSALAVPLSGRRAQAARNNQLILDAARAVFAADPGAPIAAVAEYAGVGISALYRRYRSKDELLQRLALDGLQRYTAEAETALANEDDPWNAFAQFMRGCVEAGTSSLTLRFAGAFTLTDELRQAGQKSYAVTEQLLHRTKDAAVLRSDITVGDLSLIFEQLQALRIGDQQRTNQLRQRYLALILAALRLTAEPPLPGPSPSWEEISGRYGE